MAAEELRKRLARRRARTRARIAATGFNAAFVAAAVLLLIAARDPQEPVSAKHDAADHALAERRFPENAETAIGAAAAARSDDAADPEEPVGLEMAGDRLVHPLSRALSRAQGSDGAAAPWREAEDPFRWLDSAAWSPEDRAFLPSGPNTQLFAPRAIARDDAAFDAILAVDGGVERLGPSALGRFAVESLGPIYEDFALWARLRVNSGADDLPWPDLLAFLDRRRHWPEQDKLRAAAEKAMPETLPPGEVIDFFGARRPETARGARRLGEALIAIGRREEGEAQIVEAWRTRSLDGDEERAFLARHRAVLEPHHERRVEMLVMNRQASAAQRLAKSMSAEWLALTTAASGLLRSSRGVDSLISKVPAALQDSPSLAYARMMWRHKKRRASDVEELLRERQDPAQLGDPEAWASVRRIRARSAFEDGRHEDAYLIASSHGLESGVDFAALEWFSGWLALRRLDKPTEAAAHFEKLYKGVSTPISRSRAAYWTGRAYAELGQAAMAEIWYARAADHPNTFYGQRAAEQLGARLHFADRNAPESDGADDDAAHALEQIAAALYRAERPREGALFLDAMAKSAGDPKGAIRQAERSGDLKTAIEIASDAQERGLTLWRTLYPNPLAPRFTERRTEAALLLGIARQESRFRSRAVSSAGAQGLMQMTYGTAQGTARIAGIAFDRERLERDPGYNLMLADAHVQELLQQYDGSYLLVAAAYNAGPGAVARWIRDFGDPRDPKVDAIDWIESIPYRETRNYVQRVLEATTVYRALLGGDGPLPTGLPERRMAAAVLAPTR